MKSMGGGSFKLKDSVPGARLGRKGNRRVLEVDHEPRVHLLHCADDSPASRFYGEARDLPLPSLLVIRHHQEELLRREHQHRLLLGEVERQRREAPPGRLRRPRAEAVATPLPQPLRS